MFWIMLAETTEPQDWGAILTSMWPILLLFAVMYLVIILPQKKRDKKVKEMLGAVKVGDEISTIGGIAGKIIHIQEDNVTIESGIENTKFQIKKWAIKEVKVLDEA